MFVLTCSDKTFAVLTCFFLGVTIGCFTFISRPDYVCSFYARQMSPFQCYAAVSGASTAISGVSVGFLWRFLPKDARLYVALMTTMTTSWTFKCLMTVVTYLEVVKVLRHVQQLMISPYTVALCIKDEAFHSTQLLRQTLLQEDHVNDMSQGIRDIVERLNSVNESQGQLKRSIELGFKWLESRGLSCKDVLTKPFQVCLNQSEAARKDCQEKGIGSLCDIVDISDAICQVREICLFKIYIL